MNLNIIISVIFMIVFVINLIFGKGIENFWSWLNGFAFCGAFMILAPVIKKRLKHRQ